ncbi:MAG: ROK family protein [Oscillospiraceae bacterium]|nr:ROK family protein [Oscillospiraceae bacterium]
MKYYVGIDLGGTNIVAGVVNENYEIVAKAKTPTNRPRPADEICADMVKVVKEAVEKAGLTLADIEAVGLGSPGMINSDEGVIVYANNLDFYDVKVGEILGKALGKPIYAENDANAAAYGEFVAGSAKGANTAVCITLGTGVGGGIVIDGKIYSGSNYAGGEIGHIVIEVDGAPCSCGRKGCFEAYSSATGLIRMTKEAMDANPDSLMHEMAKEDGHVSGRLSFNAMRAGDAAAKAVCDKYIKYLAAGIANVINIFQPEVLCIGGGVCNEGDALLLPLKELVESEIYTKRGDDNSKIVIASLGNDAGIIGAAFLGLQK